jgi:putative endonuclease
MPKKFTSKQQKIGELGENVAVQFYQNKGYEIVERNYTRSMGEIDIVARKGGVLYFVEVKSKRVSSIAGIEPGENMHMRKRIKIRKVILQYLLNHAKGESWQCDLAIVHLDMKTRLARVSVIENCIV